MYILLDFDRSKICISEIRKSCYLTVAQGYKSTFIPCTEKEFKAALQQIKNSLTFWKTKQWLQNYNNGLTASNAKHAKN